MAYDPNVGLTPEQLEYARKLRAGLAGAPDPMAGAIAANDGSSGSTPPPEGLPPAAPPTATDAAGAGGASGQGPQDDGTGGYGGDPYGQQIQNYRMPETAMASGAGGGDQGGTPPVIATDQAIQNAGLRLGTTVRVPAEVEIAAAQDRIAAAQAQQQAEQSQQGSGGGGGGGYGPVQVIPGGPRVQGWNITEQRGPQTPQELRQAYSDSIGALQQAGRDRAEVEAERAAFNARVAQQNAAAERTMFLEQARLKKEADKAAATEQVQSAREIVGGTWGAIGAAIVMGLGEYAARRPGGSGTNTAKAVIDRGIDQEMARQEKSIQIRRMGREERALRLANMRVAYYEQVKQQVAAKAAALGTREAEIQGRELTAKLDLEHNRYETEAARLAMGQTQVATSIANVAPKVVGGGGPAKPKSEDKELMVPGYGVALTKKDAEEARDAVAANNEIMAIGKRLKEVTATAGDRVTPEKRAQAASLKSKLLLALNKQAKAGALDKGAIEVMGPQIGSVTDVTDFGGRSAGLEETLSMAKKSLDEAMKAKGVTPAQQRVEQGPKGPTVSVNLTGEQPMKPAAIAKPIPSFRKVGQ
jgi:hypothetical protein